MAVGLACFVIAPGAGSFYPQIVIDALPFLPEPLHLMLVAMCAAVAAAALSFILASPADRAVRFRRFIDIGWDRRHRHRYALA